MEALKLSQEAYHGILEGSRLVMEGATVAAREVAKGSIAVARDAAALGLQVAAAAVQLGTDILRNLLTAFELTHLSGGFELSTKRQMFSFKVDIVVFNVALKPLDLTVTPGDIVKAIKQIVDRIMGRIEDKVDKGSVNKS